LVYKVKTRNNPFAEWVILQDNKDVVACGLVTTNGMATVKITEQNSNTALLFHAILWYLFVLIATENADDNLSFILMAQA
jgi:hypothetical protein